MTLEQYLKEVKARSEKATKAIPGYVGYEADIDGNVWSVASNWRGYGKRKLCTSLSRHGYPQVSLIANGRKIHRTVHKLIAVTFLGPCPDGYQARHLDGNKSNPAVSNLAWGTAKDNANDRDRHGTTAKGSRNGFARLNEDTVFKIKQLIKHGIKDCEIGPMFNLPRSHVNQIRRNVLWKSVTC
jgi:hypothetical protein